MTNNNKPKQPPDFIKGREFDIAKTVLHLTDGDKPNDPTHRQTCPHCGRKNGFQFDDECKQFYCEGCKDYDGLLSWVQKVKILISHRSPSLC